MTGILSVLILGTIVIATTVGYYFLIICICVRVSTRREKK